MGAGRDLFALHKNGSEFPAEIGLNPIEIDGQRMALASIVDISERRQKEEQGPAAQDIKDSSGKAAPSRPERDAHSHLM